MPASDQLTGRGGALTDLFNFLWQRKMWWMMPLIAMLVLFGILLFLAQSSAVAPWVYPL